MEEKNWEDNSDDMYIDKELNMKNKFLITIFLLTIGSINAQSIKDFTLREYLKTERIEFKDFGLVFYTPHEKATTLGGYTGLLKAHVLESGQVFKIEFTPMRNIPKIYYNPNEWYEKKKAEKSKYYRSFFENEGETFSEKEERQSKEILESEKKYREWISNRNFSGYSFTELRKNIESHYKIDFDLTIKPEVSYYTAVRNNILYLIVSEKLEYKCKTCKPPYGEEINNLTPLSGKSFTFSISDIFLEAKRKLELEDIKKKKEKKYIEKKKAEELKRVKDF